MKSVAETVMLSHNEATFSKLRQTKDNKNFAMKTLLSFERQIFHRQSNAQIRTATNIEIKEQIQSQY